MERDAIGLQAKTLGEGEHLDRPLPTAAELARQRPFGTGAVVEDAAEHLGAGGGAGDLLDLRGAVDRKQANAEREGARDVTLLLDGVAVGAPSGGTPAARAIWISATEAQSKHEPIEASSDSTSGAGLAFTA